MDLDWNKLSDLIKDKKGRAIVALALPCAIWISAIGNGPACPKLQILQIKTNYLAF